MKEFKPLLIKVTVVDLGLFILSSFCFFIGHMEIPLGFLLGATIGLLNFLLMYFQFKILIVPQQEKRIRLKSGLSFITRFIIYGLGLALALLLEKNGYKIFAWYTVFIGYLMLKIVMLVDNYLQTRKDRKSKG